MAEFRMPSLGADMDEGVLSEWLVHPGDRVDKGDIIAVVETDKSTVEVECFATGTVGELLVEPGRRVPVGTALATIAEEPAAPRRPRAAVEPAEPVPPTAPAGPAGTGPPQVESPLVRHLAHRRHVELGTVRGTGASGEITREDVERAATGPARVKVSPLARRLAAELGVDLATVRGTGTGGAIGADDVRTAAETRPETAAAKERRAETAAAKERPSRAEPAGARQRRVTMRRAIARAMTRSKREIPHYYLGTTVDLTPALGWMRGRNRELPVGQRLVTSAVLLKAAAMALGEVPQLNGHWIDGGFVPGDGVHLGVAISLRGGGLLAPAVRDADRLPLMELMAALRDLTARTRSGRLRSSELRDATVTVTNLGDQGVEFVHGVIHPPQVALVGFGTPVDRPWTVDGLIGVRQVVSVTLAADHRATDGYVGGRYLRAVARLLGRPEELS